MCVMYQDRGSNLVYLTLGGLALAAFVPVHGRASGQSRLRGILLFPA